MFSTKTFAKKFFFGLKNVNSVYVLALITAIAILASPVRSVCDGKFSGKYFISIAELTYKDAKQCCYKHHMEIFRITNRKNIPEFVEIVNNGHKTDKIKRFSFWIKKDSSSLYEKEVRVTQKCPIIQWSTLGSLEIWSSYSFCGLENHVVCMPSSVKKYKAIKQGQLTFGKRRRKREEPELGMDVVDQKVSCSLSATLNGNYISGEKLNFNSAKACCSNKNMRMVGSNLTDLEAANLKHSLCYTFQDKAQELWIASPSGNSTTQNPCKSIALEDGEFLREKYSACGNLFPALCESLEEDPEICENMQYKELEGGAYLFSNLKVPFPQASLCCRKKNMNLVNLYSYKESSAMYQIMMQNGLTNENLNFWTSGTRKMNSFNFTWHDGLPIVLQDFREFCIAALEKLNTKSFMITDYGCEKPLNFLCIDKDFATVFSRKRATTTGMRYGSHRSDDPQPYINDGFVTDIREGENLTWSNQEFLPLNKMTLVQYDLPQKETSNKMYRPKKWAFSKNSDLISFPSGTEEIQRKEPTRRSATLDSLNLVEPQEKPKENTVTEALQTTPSSVAFQIFNPYETRWQYKTCYQVKDVSPSVSISGMLTTNDALKMVILNELYDMKSTSKTSINMGPASWKKKFINQLGRILTEVCDDDELISKEFINVIMGLNSIYQSSFEPGPKYDSTMWENFYKDLENCKPKKIQLLAHAYEIYGMKETEPYTSPYTIKQLFPPEEQSEKSSEDIDPIIDALWWMTTTAHASCYKPSNDSESVWATQFKSAMQKDFFEPINYRWRHSGRDHLFFGAIVGNFNLDRMIRNMRYCATAAYWQSKIINRELRRGNIYS